MFHRLASPFVVLLAACLVRATAVARDSNHCDTGPIQCCNSVQSADSDAVTTLFGLLGITGPVEGLVGVTCSPITVIGLPGNSCSGQTVCCSNNNYNGVVALGCVVINVNA